MLITVRPGKQASKQEKSYLINIRRQQQLQDDKRKPVVVIIQCGGCVPMSQVRPKGFLHNIISARFRLEEKLSFVCNFRGNKKKDSSQKLNSTLGYAFIIYAIINHLRALNRFHFLAYV